MLRLSPSLVWLLVLSGAGCSDFKVTELEPRLSVTPQVVDFGAVPAGTEGIAQVGVVNSGAAPLTFVDPIITVDGLGSLTAVLDRPTLEPGDAGTLTLTYIPAGEESDAGTVLVGDTTGLREEVVWSGTGVVGWLQAAPSALDFGSLLVGESAEQVLALTNTGLASVTVDALTVDGDAGFTAAPMSGGLPFTIPAGSTTVAWVTYTADALDPAAATLAIHSDDPHADTLIVPLTANTEAPNNRPVISLLSPADGDTLVHTDWSISAIFSDEMKPGTLKTDTFYLQLNGVDVPGIVQYANTQAVFLTVYPMEPNLKYTATITTGAESVAGEHLAKNYEWSFTTFPCDDKDGDDVCDSIDAETCDGFDNDGDGRTDEGFDSDHDGLADCFDVEICDNMDNDGDGAVDEGFDSDHDGVADCYDIEWCDGVDNDGDDYVDEGYQDTDEDDVADCVDTETCDGLDNDGDGATDEDFDSDGDGTADCYDVEVCDGVDNDGDGWIDEYLVCA